MLAGIKVDAKREVFLGGIKMEAKEDGDAELPVLRA